MYDILSCRKHFSRIYQSLMKNKWTPQSERGWSSSKGALCCCRYVMVKKVTSLLKYKTRYPISMVFEWKIRLLRDNEYLEMKVIYRISFEETRDKLIYANHSFILSCKPFCKFLWYKALKIPCISWKKRLKVLSDIFQQILRLRWTNMNSLCVFLFNRQRILNLFFDYTSPFVFFSLHESIYIH